MGYKHRPGKSLNLVLINALILIFIIFLLEMVSLFFLRYVPEEKLLDGISLQTAIWEATYLERNLAVPEKGPREGYQCRLLGPKKIAPYVGWMDRPVKIQDRIEINQDGFQIAGDPEAAKVKILIIGGSVAFGAYASSIKNAYFSEVNDYLISQGIPCATYILASSGWQSDQEMIALLYYGLKIKPDIVIFINGLNDLVHGRQVIVNALKENFTAKNFALLALERFRKCAVNISYSLKHLALNSHIIKLIKSIKRHRNELAVSELLNDAGYDNGFKAMLNERAEAYLSNMRLAKILAQEYNFKVIYILQPFVGFKYKLSPLEKEALFFTNFFNLDQYGRAFKEIRESLSGLSDGKLAYFFDSSGALSKEEKTTFCDEFHFSDIGHKLFADSYKERLLDVLKQ